MNIPKTNKLQIKYIGETSGNKYRSFINSIPNALIIHRHSFLHDLLSISNGAGGIKSKLENISIRHLISLEISPLLESHTLSRIASIYGSIPGTTLGG